MLELGAVRGGIKYYIVCFRNFSHEKIKVQRKRQTYSEFTQLVNGELGLE